MTDEPKSETAYDVLDAALVGGASSFEGLPPPTLAELAFAGRSNVGKSSMMNALMQRRGLVRTSSTPGCTRSIQLFSAQLRSGLAVHLADLPGYGFARRSKSEKVAWGPLIEGYLLGRPTLRLVVTLIDVRRGLEEDDEQLLEFCAAPRRGAPKLARLIVATKLDLLPKSKRKPILAELAQRRRDRTVPIFGFSAVDGAGRIEVWRAIERLVLGPSAPSKVAREGVSDSTATEPTVDAEDGRTP